MITTFVQFNLPHAVSKQAAKEISLGSAQDYRKIPGLLRKYYVFSEDGTQGGGVYLWRSRQDAENLYTAEWEKAAREKYGVTPSVTYFDCPVVVDNVTDEVISGQ